MHYFGVFFERCGAVVFVIPSFNMWLVMAGRFGRACFLFLSRCVLSGAPIIVYMGVGE
ncbi:hypothetical protein BDY21DRAFT_123921 [Lineolata rhizophorae]|uniref:Uncharacterized protein n=1 Tax=Lineolata rhizophorae TaxID=578093 RepID=A0A6A6NQH9_9PEZI|nr:hypothetical protein BDY21DRAFT_123921 [Lineolata rhizophorae]